MQTETTKQAKPVKLTANQQKAYDRIVAGEIPTLTRVTGSCVRGIKEGSQPPVFPNGDKVLAVVLESLVTKGLLEKKLTNKFGTWGYMDRTYSFYLTGQAPMTECDAKYAL